MALNPAGVNAFDDCLHARLIRPEKFPSSVANRLVLGRMLHPDRGPKNSPLFSHSQRRLHRPGRDHHRRPAESGKAHAGTPYTHPRQQAEAHRHRKK